MLSQTVALILGLKSYKDLRQLDVRELDLLSAVKCEEHFEVFSSYAKTNCCSKRMKNISSFFAVRRMYQNE